ncbi:hypothetical protein SELMODRAFT_131333 [Selaginella moellendorffii]|uniref:Replication protein A subunit n=1 Tax=Selaginella moellendorffii TaxID=88036 RepID=D8T3W4_SELML|nr:hypothetical protein SELMODRAFT_131333 [Selaginella moellendorffii]
MPIKDINDHCYRWSLRARVTHKGKLVFFETGTAGCVMSVDVADAESSEIRIVGFGENAKRLSSEIEQGSVYIFSGNSGVQRSKPAYTPYKSNWEIKASKTMEIKRVEDDLRIPNVVLKRTSVLDASKLSQETFVDVIGGVMWIGQKNISPKDSGAFMRRRMLCLSDESGHSIDMCLWDSKAEDEGSEIEDKLGRGERPIVCVKGGRISDYNGKSISVTGGSTLLVDPELEDVSRLREWMVASYDTTSFVHVTNSSSKAVISGTKAVSEMLSINLKVSEFSAIFRVIVSVKEIQTGDFYYPACMKVVNGRQCGKKVTQVSESMWQCNSCDSDSGDIQLKYALHLCILDSTGHIWAVAFDDAANEIVGMPACKLAALQDDDYTGFSAIMDSIRSKMYNLKVRCKLESYRDTEKLKFFIVGLDT